MSVNVKHGRITGTPHFAPWSDDPDPPEYWEENDYRDMRKRLRAYWGGGSDIGDAVRMWNEQLHARNEEGEFGHSAANRKAKQAKALAALSGRAKKGGEIAQANEYFYKGGQFLPITSAPPGSWRIKVKGKASNLPNGSDLIEPGKRQERPTPFSVSVHQVMGAGTYVNIDEGVASVNPNVNWDYLGITPDTAQNLRFKQLATSVDQYSTNDLVELYNKGVRWIDLEPNKDVEIVAKSQPAPSGDVEMTQAELDRHRELEENYSKLTPEEMNEWAKLNERFDAHWAKKTSERAATEAAEVETERRVRLLEKAAKVAKDLDFPFARIDFIAGTREFEVNGVKHTAAGDADIAKGDEGRIRMYFDHLNETNVVGVMAHEIEHMKFQHALDLYKADTDAMMKDPGPAPDPNAESYPQRRGGSHAVMQPDGTLREAYAKKYPIYTMMHEAYSKGVDEFAAGDGVSRYSAEYWKAWHEHNAATSIAMHETLAEMARVKYTTGKFPEHYGYSAYIGERNEARPLPEGEIVVPKAAKKDEGQTLWRNLYRTVDKLWKEKAAPASAPSGILPSAGDEVIEAATRGGWPMSTIGRDNTLIDLGTGEHIIAGGKVTSLYRKGDPDKNELAWVQLRRISKAEAFKMLRRT